jgi:hypothetical protein
LYAIDPFGSLVANAQPPSGGPPPYMPVYGATYGGLTWNSFINANNFSSGCYSAQNNNPSICNGALQEQMARMGSAFWGNLPGVPPDPYAESRYVFNMNNSIYGGSSGQSGYAPDSHDVFYGDIYSSSVTVYAGAAFLQTSQNPQSAQPQKPYRTPLSAQEIGQLENAVNTLLKKDTCQKFVAGVLQRLGSKLGAMDIIKALKERPIDRSGAGGFGRMLKSEWSAQAVGAFAYGNPGININYKIDPTVANVPVFIRSDGFTVLHEIFHIAGSGAGHWKMLVAGYAVATEMGLKLGRKPADTDPTKGTTDPNIPDGIEFDSYLWQTCDNMR